MMLIASAQKLLIIYAFVEKIGECLKVEGPTVLVAGLSRTQIFFQSKRK